MIRKLYITLSLACVAFLSACSQPGQQASNTGVKLGKPYEIDGRVYSPTYNPSYDETGIASWYGPGFHGGLTASGERYDQNDITAAHKTLPMPSIVKVTNLDNGRSTIVRINDRGPFVGDRLIDLSKGAATQLGMLHHGTAHVRVQFLDHETREYVSNLPNGAQSLKRLDMFAKGGSGRAYNPNDIMVSDVTSPPVAVTPQTMPAAPVQIAQVSEPSKSLPFVAPSYPGYPQRVMAAKQPVVREPVDKAPAVAQVAYVTPVSPALPKVESDSAAVPVTAHVAVVGEKYADAARSFGSRPYFIQAGTFGIKDNAERMLGALSEIGQAKIVESIAREKKLYRVLAGPFNSRADAENILSRLDTAGISGAKIIRD